VLTVKRVFNSTRDVTQLSYQIDCVKQSQLVHTAADARHLFGVATLPARQVQSIEQTRARIAVAGVELRSRIFAQQATIRADGRSSVGSEVAQLRTCAAPIAPRATPSDGEMESGEVDVGWCSSSAVFTVCVRMNGRATRSPAGDCPGLHCLVTAGRLTVLCSSPTACEALISPEIVFA